MQKPRFLNTIFQVYVCQVSCEILQRQVLLKYAQGNGFRVDSLHKLGRTSWRMSTKEGGRKYFLKLAKSNKEQFFLQNEYYWLTNQPAISGNRQVRLELLGDWKLLVGDYLLGENFSDILRRILPKSNHAQQMAPLMGQLEVIVNNCHASHCLHGDLKPNNLLLVAAKVVPIDFANARYIDSDDSLRPYYSYSQSYSLPCQRVGLDRAEISQDWFSFFMLLAIAMQGEPVVIDWRQSTPLAGVFDTSLERFNGLITGAEDSLQRLRSQLDVLCQLRVVGTR